MEYTTMVGKIMTQFSQRSTSQSPAPVLSYEAQGH